MSFKYKKYNKIYLLNMFAFDLIIEHIIEFIISLLFSHFSVVSVFVFQVKKHFCQILWITEYTETFVANIYYYFTSCCLSYYTIFWCHIKISLKFYWKFRIFFKILHFQSRLETWFLNHLYICYILFYYKISIHNNIK